MLLSVGERVSAMLGNSPLPLLSAHALPWCFLQIRSQRHPGAAGLCRRMDLHRPGG